MRPMAGASIGASGGLPISTLWSSTMPSVLSTTWALKPNSTGRPSRPLAMGRASVSWRDTIRVAPSGTSPARRVRVWATICSSTAMVRSSSVTRAVALPEAPAPARRSARRAFMATTWASLMVASAMVANSPVKTSTSSLASPLRRRSQAAI